MTSRDITIAEYFLDRLASLGVDHLFGVPGDYNLAFLDKVMEYPRIEWVGNANELGAAYAADGYARVRGIGALLTTFGVGELSAINGVGGSYAEYVPVVHLAMSPSTAAERAGALVHHTAGDGDFERFARAQRSVSAAMATVTRADAAEQIDRVLMAALRERRPVYLRMASDVALAPTAAPTRPLPDEGRSFPVGAASLERFATAAGRALAGARNAAVLADFLVDRFGAREELAELLDITQLPFATLCMGKTVADESRSTSLGVYSGALGDPRIRRTVEDADVLIRAGVRLADTTSGGFSQGFDTGRGIDLQPESAFVDGVEYPGVPLGVALKALTGVVAGKPLVDAFTGVPEVSTAEAAATGAGPSAAGAGTSGAAASGVAAGGSSGGRALTDEKSPRPDEPLTQSYLWPRLARTVQEGQTVVAEQGTSYYGLCTQRFPAGARFIGQPLWGSIGYSLPALLGAQLAAPGRRCLLAIGDGSAQMTAQELGTIGRYGLTPVIVLVNNGGYTVERAIHGPEAAYNGIARWDWQRLPAALGVRDALCLSAATPAELDRALAAADEATDRLVLLEVHTATHDAPELLLDIVAEMSSRNGES
ncbi:alpha-keto acid decarboxylase family protein [Streptomyces lushanensis]|uniref:alpha-keto acid decarboxylase family protein n=1 Tax=Streptomyces lushanensis TaxID=1434255 RepID=UPI0008327CDE|nr:thiamine pyrophosphate-binding protein [Streptomyces lushanensis]